MSEDSDVAATASRGGVAAGQGFAAHRGAHRRDTRAHAVSCLDLPVLRWLMASTETRSARWSGFPTSSSSSR